MNWYSRLKTSNTNYLDIGHNFDSKECVLLWFFSPMTGFQSTPCTREKFTHSRWKEYLNYQDTSLFTGRIDICKKEASIACHGECSGVQDFGNMKCDSTRDYLEDAIKTKFGRNIRISRFSC